MEYDSDDLEMRSQDQKPRQALLPINDDSRVLIELSAGGSLAAMCGYNQEEKMTVVELYFVLAALQLIHGTEKYLTGWSERSADLYQ